jgi:iron(III) transport system substrate-binding protein
MLRLGLLCLLAIMISCSKKDERQEVWIYTSLYKDTIAEMTPKLEKAFPKIKINWYQAGSEEIAAKVNTELMAGEPKADLLISSERFWYQELSETGKLHAFQPKAYNDFYDDLKWPEGTFYVASIPVMVLVFNNEVIKLEQAPKSFLALTESRFKDQISGGSPLSSGTNFTTLAALQKKYGWDYFKKLKANNFLFDGGNSAVVKRIQNKEKPIGWVLLENILRFQKQDPRLQVIYPEDGVVTQFNTLAITKKNKSREVEQQITDWIFSQEGQQAMINSFMYSPLKNFQAPQGAPARAARQSPSAGR